MIVRIKKNILNCFLLMREYYSILLFFFIAESVIFNLELLSVNDILFLYEVGKVNTYNVLANIVLLIIFLLIIYTTIYYKINNERFEEINKKFFEKFIRAIWYKILTVMIVILLPMNIFVYMLDYTIPQEYILGFLIIHTITISKYFIFYMALSIITRKYIDKKMGLNKRKENIKIEHYIESIFIIVATVLITGFLLFMLNKYIMKLYYPFEGMSYSLDFFNLMTVEEKPKILVIIERIVNVFTKSFIILYTNQFINNLKYKNENL